MSIFDKAKELGDKVNESVTGFSSDELIANTVIRAVEKQEKVNAILKQKGCNYRLSDIDLGMGIPPSVTFGVRRLDEDKHKEETNSSSQNQTVRDTLE